MAHEDLHAELLDRIGLRELCGLCRVPAELVIELVDEGIVEPAGYARSGPYFTAVAVRRVQVARRLQRDLGINRAGAGLALDLLDELESLRARIRALEAQFGD